jgi:hypothetical protein
MTIGKVKLPVFAACRCTTLSLWYNWCFYRWILLRNCHTILPFLVSPRFLLNFVKASIFFSVGASCSRESRGSTIGIATWYRLREKAVGVRVPIATKTFHSSCLPDWFWGPPSLLSNGYQRIFLGDKAAGVWNWTLTSNSAEVKNVYLYIHSPYASFV